jgi:GTPase SAR1 family protein
MGIVIVYDVTDRKSFETVTNWMLTMMSNTPFRNDKSYDGLPLVMLVGNKCDSERRQIPIEEGETYANDNNLLFIETSAMENTNVEDMFMILAKLVFEKAVLNVDKKHVYIFGDEIEIKKPVKNKSSFCIL